MNESMKVEKESMKPHELHIAGMSCNHCITHVKNSLGTIDGLEIEDVQVGKARVWFDDKKVAKETIAEKVDEAGYTLISVQ